MLALSDYAIICCESFPVTTVRLRRIRRCLRQPGQERSGATRASDDWTGADACPSLGRGRGARGDATFGNLMRDLGSQAGRPSIVCQTHGHVNVFKNQPRGDASRTVGGFDQIIARLATMFPAERVDKEERLGELSSFDQETGAIDFPCCRIFSHVHLPFGGRENEKAFSLCDCRFSTALSSSASMPEA